MAEDLQDDGAMTYKIDQKKGQQDLNDMLKKGLKLWKMTLRASL